MAGWVGSSVRVPGTSMRVYGGKRMAWTPTKDRTRIGYHHESDGRLYRLVKWDQRYASGKRKSWQSVERWNDSTETWVRTDLGSLPGEPVLTDEGAQQHEAWAAAASLKAEAAEAKATARAERRAAWESTGHVLPYIPRWLVATLLAVVVAVAGAVALSALDLNLAPEPGATFCGMDNHRCDEQR